MISVMQNKCSIKRIFIGKKDLDAAYRRIHANANTKSTRISIVDKLDFLCLRLSFGTTLAPAEYTNTRKTAIDLGNELIRDESWDTTDLNLPNRNSLME